MSVSFKTHLVVMSLIIYLLQIC